MNMKQMQEEIYKNARITRQSVIVFPLVVVVLLFVVLALFGCTYPTYYRGDQEVTMQDQMACGRWIAGELNPLDLMFRTNVMYEAADRCLRSKGYVCDDSKADAGVCPGSVKR